MIHLDPIGDFAPHHPCETQELERHRGKLLRVERLRSKVEAAKAAAAESLSRANDAPEPHDSANTLFVALFDAHCRDREKLFEAMRELDEACRELHAASAGMNFVASLPHRPAKQLEGTAFHR
ncbi:hypothetical protein [Nitratireductor sp.]|uniref:hypothetical protein n=1 Tax=Nitratireductor sp. TaxID=1872084 RepID=UPI002612F79D|nr:hypothetical protein [Nitratireductor sp.]MCV0379531.1 hypothetical protein [Nitratireductor sp.]